MEIDIRKQIDDVIDSILFDAGHCIKLEEGQISIICTDGAEEFDIVGILDEDIPNLIKALEKILEIKGK